MLKEVYKERKLRLVGVGVSNLVDTSENYQTSIFDEIKETKNHRKYEKVDKTVDDIKNKFGSSSITYASNLQCCKSVTKQFQLNDNGINYAKKVEKKENIQ